MSQNDIIYKNYEIVAKEEVNYEYISYKAYEPHKKIDILKKYIADHEE